MRLICRDISKTFPSARGVREVLKGISFSVEERQYACIVGPTGCGKTTLLRVIAGLLEPTCGSVAFESGKAGAIRMVFQESGVFPWMTALENVSFGVPDNIGDKKERLRLAMELLEKAGLKKSAHLYPGQMSVGMKKMTGLLRALASRPAVMLLDEPLSSIDIFAKEILKKEILMIWKEYGVTMIHVTHDIEEALFLADRIFIINGTPAELCQEFRVPFARPRDEAVADSPEFRILKKEIWGFLRPEVDRRIKEGAV